MNADVSVIGAGPAGLAVAGALAMRGVRAVVLERGTSVGSSWRRHYDRLHLHTPRELSGLPGMPIPKEFGRWVARDDVVRYLERYAEHHGLDVRTGVMVDRIDRSDGASSGWQVNLANGEVLRPEQVVITTGNTHTPQLPQWPGQDSFEGSFSLAADYRNAKPFAGQSVLVVGTGNTGAEIATDLADGGASRVWLSVRTPPWILPRDRGPLITANALGIGVRHLPVPLVDRLQEVLRKVEGPDLTAYGLPVPHEGMYSAVKRGRLPVQDVGIVTAIRERKVIPVPAPERFDGAAVVLTDGRRLRPDVVLLATGYRAGLEPLVGHLGVLDERGQPRARGGTPARPGLWFVGYTNPISGALREIRLEANRLAKAMTMAD